MRDEVILDVNELAKGQKLTKEEAWQQVAGPPIADVKDRKGNGGGFYQYCRQTGSWPKAVSGWDPKTEPEKFYPYMAVKNVTADYPPTLLFHGELDTDVPLECGCPPPVPVMRTAAPVQIVPESQLPAKVTLGAGTAPVSSPESTAENKPAVSSGAAPAGLPASKPDDVHVQVDAPLVFSRRTRASAPPAPIEATRELGLADIPERQVHLDAMVQPPPPVVEVRSPVKQKKTTHQGFFGRVGQVFSGLFK